MTNSQKKDLTTRLIALGLVIDPKNIEAAYEAISIFANLKCERELTKNSLSMKDFFGKKSSLCLSIVGRYFVSSNYSLSEEVSETFISENLAEIKNNISSLLIDTVPFKESEIVEAFEYFFFKRLRYESYESQPLKRNLSDLCCCLIAKYTTPDKGLTNTIKTRLFDQIVTYFNREIPEDILNIVIKNISKFFFDFTKEKLNMYSYNYSKWYYSIDFKGQHYISLKNLIENENDLRKLLIKTLK